MSGGVLGLHHVTAVARDPQRNVDFYTDVLGLRIVKRTVNFDEPETYHLYYGDAEGHPGTLVTFFPWPHAGAGRVGPGQVVAIGLALMPQALGYWRDRLFAHRVTYQAITGRFKDEGIAFTDPDGLPLELIASSTADPARTWTRGPVPPDYAIHGLHSVTAWVQRPDALVRVLKDTLGFKAVGESKDRLRFAAGGEGGGQTGAFVDVRTAAAPARGVSGTGTVHHIAFRVTDDAAQLDARPALVSAGLRPTPVIDRQYFRSIYFHEPGGVLCELATDAPGFLINESFETLGQRLELPPQFEPSRPAIEATLPPITVPVPAAPGPRPRSIAEDAQIQRGSGF